ncbi:MAG: hypothetical protein RIS64_2420 [Bacteroidota bacterium]|jgi:hypothetical protein
MIKEEGGIYKIHSSFTIHHSNERFSVAFTEQVGISAIAADTYQCKVG